ncbi:RAD52 motif-containing protein 1-like isoform X1 [Argonauta hians]
MSDIEVIEFCPPHSNRKNLFVTNIPLVTSPAHLYKILYEKFSEFGLLFEIQLFSNTNRQPLCFSPGGKLQENGSEPPSEPGDGTIGKAYAFVKYYSIKDCYNARRHLSGNLYIDGVLCKASINAKRKSAFEMEYLSLSRCYDVANYYFGFNGWTTDIKLLKQDLSQTAEADSTKSKLCFYCFSCVSVPIHGITADGFGAWEENYNKNEPLQKLTAYHKVRKICYQRSLVNAFSKILVLVLPNGKVSAALNTLKPDTYSAETVDTPLLQINELDEEPEEDEETLAALPDGGLPVKDGETLINDTTTDLDQLNIHLLQELEN